jgi:hypothetical protein
MSTASREPNTRIASLHDAIEQLRHRFRIEEATTRVAEHPVIRAVREVVAL